jgi:hypothetical protein
MWSDADQQVGPKLGAWTRHQRFKLMRMGETGFMQFLIGAGE